MRHCRIAVLPAQFWFDNFNESPLHVRKSRSRLRLKACTPNLPEGAIVCAQTRPDFLQTAIATIIKLRQEMATVVSA
jgi:hypothetical protein